MGWLRPLGQGSYWAPSDASPGVLVGMGPQVLESGWPVLLCKVYALQRAPLNCSSF